MEHASETAVAYERDFKGIWTPSFIWTSSELTPTEKFILMEIDSLDSGEGCYASNEHLAEVCCCSENKVSVSISKLVKMGYLERVAFDGRKRILASRVFEKQSETLQKTNPDFLKNKPSYKYVRYIDESTSLDKPPIVPLPAKRDRDDEVREVVAFLNLRANKAFKPDTAATRRVIIARLSEGWTVGDLKKVVEVKCRQWAGSRKMSGYLRPETLFNATKFEGYLNEYAPASGGFDGFEDEADVVIGGGAR